MALRVWLPLNGNIDNKGLSNYSLKTMGTGIVFNTNGKIGKSVTFPNSPASCLYIDGGLKMQNLTWTCWFKSLGAGSGTSQRILSEGRDTGNRGVEIWLSKDGLTLNAFARGKGFSTSTTINTWHHVALVAGDTEVSLYLDGALINTVSPSAANDYAQSSDAFVIGKMSYSYTATTNYFPFNGYINDVRIYDECLSQKQIKEISKGLVAHYKLTGVGANPNLLIGAKMNQDCNNKNWTRYGLNSVTSSVYTGEAKHIITPLTGQSRNNGEGFSWTDITSEFCPLEIGNTYTFSMDIKGTIDSTSTGGYLAYMYNSNPDSAIYQKIFAVTDFISTLKKDTYTRYSMTFTVPSEAQYKFSLQILIGYGGDIYYKNVKLEKGDKKTSWVPNINDIEYTKFNYENDVCTDVSGNGYTATKSGTLTFNSDSPRYEGSTYFNGSSYLTSAIGSMNWFDFNNFTISAWFKPTVKPSTWTGSVGIQQDAGSSWKTFSISNYAGNFSVHTDNGSTWVTTQSNELPLNEWSFCAATLTNGTDLKMYINGVQVKTATIDYSTAIVRDDTRIAIGVDLPGDDEKYTGYYSDVRVYATALSANDILTMYKNSGIIDNKGNVYAYEFKEE